MKKNLIAALMITCCFLLTGFAGGCSSGAPAIEGPGSAGSGSSAENNAQAQEQAPADDSDYAQTRPRVSVRDELTVVFSKNDLELDFRKSYMATEAQIFTALYEGLFTYNPLTMEPVLASASRYEISEDRKQWTFTIRNSARFWNGDALRAEDFRAAWLSLLRANEDSPYSSLFDIIEGARDYRLGISNNPLTVGITAVNDRTLVVRLNAPAAFFPSMLCHHSFSPIHPSMMNVMDWSKSPPVSNGPFYIKESSEDEMILLKNDFYWDADRTSLNKITIKFSDNAEEAAALWNSGTARWIAGT